MQTILGSGGAIGIELAKALPSYTSKIRLVSRSPEKVNNSDELFKADMTKAQEVLDAVEGSEIVYLTVGLSYSAKVWANSWPLVIENVIDACRVHKAKLVFFDNIYMYDPSTVGEMRETNPMHPQSKKGKVRKLLVDKITGAIESKTLQALIARSADFYGPSIDKVSMLTETVFKPLSLGKKASCLGNIDKLHSFTYTPDAGKALAILGNTEEAYGETWHLPTSSESWTTRQFINNIAAGLDKKAIYQVAGKSLVRILGIFIPIMREIVEMLYQYDQDYVFISEKFEKKFDFKPTSYEQGIKEIIEKDYS
jgi:nucleoside-diphosphate-sugar epimerase